MTYRPAFHPDGRKVYDPGRTERDIQAEWAALTLQVKAEDPGCRFPEMRARELWRQQEEAGERWSEWQQRVWLPRMRALALARPKPPAFSVEQLERLVELHAGANDEVTRSLAEVAQALLDRPGASAQGEPS